MHAALRGAMQVTMCEPEGLRGMLGAMQTSVCKPIDSQVSMCERGGFAWGHVGSRVMLAMQGMVRNARMCDASVFFLSGAQWLLSHPASPLRPNSFTLTSQGLDAVAASQNTASPPRPHFPTFNSQGLGGDYYSTSAGQREKMLTATQVWTGGGGASL